jgi:hypothetical protein
MTDQTDHPFDLPLDDKWDVEPAMTNIRVGAILARLLAPAGRRATGGYSGPCHRQLRIIEQLGVACRRPSVTRQFTSPPASTQQILDIRDQGSPE